MRKAILALFFVLFACLTIYNTSVFGQNSIPLEDQKVIYQLPYPGILPDHPLFFLKRTRDNLIEFLTRDNIKKAELYFLMSDKYIVMASQLAEKDRDELATKTLTRAEDYFQKMISYLKISKQQGVRPSDDLVRKAQNSNIKHREIIENLMKELPQGNSGDLAKVLKMNKASQKEIEKIK